MAFITSVTSSAPSRPRLERRSDIAVKPEMSMKATVPSTSRHDAKGSSRSHSSVSRGMNGTRSVGVGESAFAGVAAIPGILLYGRSGAKGGCCATSGVWVPDNEQELRGPLGGLHLTGRVHGTFTPPQRNPPGKGTSDTS